MSQTVPRRTPTLEELRRRREDILELAARHGAYNIRVFGSVARGDAGDTSDVDLLIDMEKGRSLLDLAGFHVEIQDLLHCEVDVATRVKSRLREKVEAEAVPL